jgi:hypothetical protein
MVAPDFISAIPRPGHVCRIFEDHEEGVFADIDIEDYHTGPGVSSSHLKALADLEKTPRHFYWEHIRGYIGESTESMNTGRMWHALCEDPTQEEFRRQFVVLPENLTLRSKAGKAIADDAAQQGKTLVREKEYKAALDGTNNLYSEPWFRKLVEHPDRVFEASVYKRCSLTGLMRRARPDLWVPGVAIVDFKTTTKAGPSEFARQCGQLKYNLQQEFYKSVCEEDNFIFVAMEKSFPYLCAPYDLDRVAAMRGREQMDYALTLLAQCYESGHWPGYHGGVIEPPPYSLK